MAEYDDEEGGEHSALQAIMDMLDSKGGELMKDKYGPKDAPVAGHVVTVEIKPHGGQEGSKADDDEVTDDMLKHMLGDGDGDEKE